MKHLFNDNWYFCKSSLDSPMSIFFNTDEWEAVDIPHDWMIYDSTDLYAERISCYKKTFFIDDLGMDRLSLIFDGVYMDTTIYLNENEIFYWPYGYSQFEVDLTNHLSVGENTIYVKSVYRLPNSRWYPGSGIYRNVWLSRKPAIHFNTNGGYLSTQKSTNATWRLHADYELQNDSSQSESVTLIHRIFDSNHNEITQTSKNLTLEPGLTIDKDILEINNPILWDNDSPTLYTIESELHSQNHGTDTEKYTFGFRTIAFDCNKGFFLNGKNVKINGTCEHHTLGSLGAAMNKEALRRQLTIMKKMGVNAIRSAHNMPAVELLELCDEMGLLLFTESFDMWEHCKTDYDYGNYFKEWWKSDLTSWVRQDRNHPCVFIWGIGNEIHDITTDRGLEVTRLLRDEVKKLDYYHNAFVAMGSNVMGSEGAIRCSDEVDLVGYNYSENLYDKHHEDHPDWCIFGSETSSTLQSRGIYHFPLENRLLTFEDGQCSSLGNCTTNWGAKNTDVVVSAHREREYCFGQFIWTGFDYIGEPTPYFTKNSYFGQVDTAGFPKDSYYHYMSEWTSVKTNPFIHILPYWDFNEGQKINVRIFSNASKVELFFNNKSMGVQTIDHINALDNISADYLLTYSPGKLKAFAYDEQGNIIATKVQKSFGDSQSVCLIPNKDFIWANGDDLVFVEISTLDSNGTFVANSRNRMYVSVTGAGRLIGLDNGDSTDFEQYKGTSRKLFSGRLMAIIAAKDTPGDIHIEVNSKGLSPASLTIPAKEAAITPGISCFMENTPTYEDKKDEIPVRKIELIYTGETTLTPDHPTATIKAAIYPENATYQDIEFKAVTLDAVESPCVKIEAIGKTAHLTALGDGTFQFLCTCKNGTQVHEIISQLDFKVEGVGEATLNPYKMVNGINYTDCTSEAKLSFQGGVYTTDAKRTRFLYSQVDFGEYGATDIHIPIFSFENELPIEVWLGDSNDGGTLLVKDYYRAKSWYNHYQENVYLLPQRIKGIQSISIVVYPSIKLSLQGFYCTMQEKAYGKLYAIERNSISGDSFEIAKKTINNIGNNVTISYNHMNFGVDGPKQITICGHSPIPVNTIHIRFLTENGTEIRHMVDFPYSEDYQELTFPISEFKGSGSVNFIFMPGSKFDFDWFKFD